MEDDAPTNSPSPPPSPDGTGSKNNLPYESAYESPDPERPSSTSPTEPQLEASITHDPYAALRESNFRLFSFGWVISIVGYQMQSAAIGWEIFDRTGSKLQLGWIAGIQAIPLMVLALPAGWLADVLDRRRIVAVTAFLAAGSSMALATLSYKPGTIIWMYVFIMIHSAMMTLGRPARSALLPLTVPKHLFSNAITWNSTIFQVASMAGPALAGLIIAFSLRRFGNLYIAYALDAICVAIFGLTMLLIHIRKPDLPQTERPDRDIAAGIRFVWRTRIILATMTLDLFAVLLGGSVYLLPVFAKDILHVSEVGFGWLRAAEAIGAFTTALIIAHLPPMKRAGRAMLLAVAGFGACTVVFGLSHWFWLSFAMLMLIGACDNISVVVRHTLVQVLTPDEMRGRVSAVNNIFIGASNELGGLESGLTAAWLGPVRAVVCGGIGTILVVASIATLSPHLRKFGRLDSRK